MPHMAYATYPAKADAVLIGWDRLARNHPVFLRNALVAFDLDFTSEIKPGADPSNPDSFIHTLGVLGVTDSGRSVLLAQFTGPTAHEAREDWMRANARTWLT